MDDVELMDKLLAEIGQVQVKGFPPFQLQIICKPNGFYLSYVCFKDFDQPQMTLVGFYVRGRELLVALLEMKEVLIRNGIRLPQRPEPAAGSENQTV